MIKDPMDFTFSNEIRFRRDGKVYAGVIASRNRDGYKIAVDHITYPIFAGIEKSGKWPMIDILYTDVTDEKLSPIEKKEESPDQK
jgi:hypothetical protein